MVASSLSHAEAVKSLVRGHVLRREYKSIVNTCRFPLQAFLVTEGQYQGRHRLVFRAMDDTETNDPHADGRLRKDCPAEPAMGNGSDESVEQLRTRTARREMDCVLNGRSAVSGSLKGGNMTTFM